MPMNDDRRQTPLSENALREQILAAILEVAPDLERENLGLDPNLRGDLGLDSIDLINIASAIHERTGSEIPEAAWSHIETVDDLIAFFVAGGATEA